MPVVYILAMVGLFLHRHRVAAVKAIHMRETFTDKFHDIVNIAGTMTSKELRKLAFELLDDDVSKMNRVLEILQKMMLGLQPPFFFRQRCMQKPFEVVRPGRIEGELLARGVRKPDDHREEARQLCVEMRARYMNTREAPGQTRKSNSRLRQLSRRVRGHEEWVQDLFQRIDLDGSGAIGRDEFVQGALDCLGNATPLKSEDLQNVFGYVDHNGDGQIVEDELTRALSGLSEPLCPPWLDAQEFASRRPFPDRPAATAPGAAEPAAAAPAAVEKAADANALVAEELSLASEMTDPSTLSL